jgi:hypothetical protein
MTRLVRGTACVDSQPWNVLKVPRHKDAPLLTIGFRVVFSDTFKEARGSGWIEREFNEPVNISTKAHPTVRHRGLSFRLTREDE